MVLRWLEALIVVVLLVLVSMGASLAGHLLSPHTPTHAQRDVRLAVLVLVTAGEAVLLQHIISVLTGHVSVVLDFLVGRVFGLLCPLFLIQATVGYPRTQLRNTDKTEVVSPPGISTTERNSGASIAERSKEPGRPKSRRTVGSRCRGLHRLKRFLASFLPSYLYTVALVMAGSYILSPGVYQCFVKIVDANALATSFSDNPGVGVQKRVLNAPHEIVPPTDKGHIDDACTGGSKRNEVVNESRSDSDGELIHYALESGGGETENGHTDPMVEDMNLEKGEAMEKHVEADAGVLTEGICVCNVNAEILLYLLYFMPLALYWTLISFWPPERILTFDELEAYPYEKAATVGITSKHERSHGPSSACVPPNAETAKGELLLIEECPDYSPHSGIHGYQSLKEKLPLPTLDLDVETGPVVSALQTISPPLPLEIGDVQQEMQKECHVCQQLASCVSMATVVMVMQSLLCPLLWGAPTWFWSRQLRVVPTEVMFLPAFSALCFVFRAIGNQN